MLIRVVNPNTSAAMTRSIAAGAAGVAAVGTTVEAVTSRAGPASVESHYDEALAVPGLLAEIARGEADGADGYVLACFGDPGLDAARELARGPVVGLAEAAMRTATYLGRGFTVVTSLARTCGRAWDLAQRYGVAGACRGVHACGMEVLELEAPGSAARDEVLDACRWAVEHDDADVLVLGCAGMAPLLAHLREHLGVPVVDGVAAATAQVQALVTMGLATSTRGELAAPPPKPYSGWLAPFGDGGAGLPGGSGPAPGRAAGRRAGQALGQREVVGRPAVDGERRGDVQVEVPAVAPQRLVQP